MIHNDGLSNLQQLVKQMSPPLIEAAKDTPLETIKLAPGERIQASVLAQLPNGRFQVSIKDELLDLNLPRNTQPGEKLDLTVVANKPQLTLALTRDLATTLTQPRGDVSLSDTARFLGALLEKAGEAAQRQGQSVVQGSAKPLLDGMPTAQRVEQLASQLKGAMTQSGLFYESQQAEWATGQRPLQDLLQQPQGRMSPLLQAGLVDPDGLNASQANQTGTNQSSAASNPANATLNQPAGMERLAAPVQQVVQQQLEALDSRQVLWQGQVWPNQTMEWQVKEEVDERDGQGEVVARHWQTSVRLELPHLGAVHAQLRLVGGQVQLAMRAAEQETAALLQSRLSLLDARMGAAGLQLAGARIEQDDAA